MPPTTAVIVAFPASSTLPPTSKIPIVLLKSRWHQLLRCSPPYTHHHKSQPYYTKITKAQLGEPSKSKLQLINVKEILWEAIPDPVKSFPWKNAGEIFLKQLLVIGKKTLKLSLMVLFILSSLSDVIFSIYRNQELMIPFGLFIGCLMADFFNEVSQEVFQTPEEKQMNLHLLGIASVFVLAKVISPPIAVRGRVFLLHVANGGLMQVLWLWRNLSHKNNEGNEENLITGEGTS